MQLAMVTVVGFCSLTQGTATKGWTAVVPKMQENPHNFVITENDVAWLGMTGRFCFMLVFPLLIFHRYNYRYRKKQKSRRLINYFST